MLKYVRNVVIAFLPFLLGYFINSSAGISTGIHDFFVSYEFVLFILFLLYMFVLAKLATTIPNRILGCATGCIYAVTLLIMQIIRHLAGLPEIFSEIIGSFTNYYTVFLLWLGEIIAPVFGKIAFLSDAGAISLLIFIALYMVFFTICIKMSPVNRQLQRVYVNH